MRGKILNVAVAGLGFMGVTHLRVYQKIRRVRIVAVCGHSRLPVNGVLRGVCGNIQNAGEIQLGTEVKIYRDFAELLADGAVDAVDICTPTELHSEQIIAALRAGKHVLCEKPMAENVAAARKILRVAAQSEFFLMPAMCMRFWPGWHWLKKVVSEKMFGAVRAAHFQRVTARPAWSRAGTHVGGALLDLHIHDTDFVNFLFGRPSAVFSTGVKSTHGDVDHVVTQYIYPRGPAVHAEGSWLLSDGFNMGYTIYCERATIDFNLARGAAALHVREAGKKLKILKLKSTDGYGEEIRYFVDCVRRGERPALVTAQDGVTALEICAAEEKSLYAGAVIKL